MAPLDDDPADDAGFTLAELSVAMLVTALCLGLFSTSLISVLNSTRRSANLASAQQGIRQAFLLMDKQIRYADGITAPATISGDQWIEWHVPDPTLSTAQSATKSRCYQWRASASTRSLQYRTWVVPTSGAVSTPAWNLVATGLVLTSTPVFTTSAGGLAASPFLLPAAGTTYGLAYPKVGVSLTVSLNNPPGRSAGTSLFTALNASSSNPSSACTEVARS